MIVSTADLADALGVTPRRIQELENEGILSKSGRNQWDLTACIEAYLDYKVKAVTQTFELSEARAKKELADAELKEIALAEKKGELVSVKRLEKDLSDIASTISNRLYSLPNKINQKIKLDDEISEILTEQIEAVLTELKNAEIYKRYLNDESQEGEI